MFIDCGYDPKTEMVNYKFKMGDDVAISTFKVSKDKVAVIAPELVDGVRVDNEDIYKKLYAEFIDERYKIYKGVYVDKEATDEQLEIVFEALEYDKNIFVEYEPGWEIYPADDELDAICSDDGLTHVYRIGKSTGEKPILLAIELGEYSGGEFVFKGIKTLKLVN